MIFSILVHCVIQVSELWNSNIVIDCYLVSTLLRTVLKVQVNHFKKFLLFIILSKNLIDYSNVHIVHAFLRLQNLTKIFQFYSKVLINVKTNGNLIKIQHFFVFVYITCKKFRYSKKAVKIDEISTLDLTLRKKRLSENY